MSLEEAAAGQGVFGPDKVKIRFQAVNAPDLKKHTFKINGSEPFANIVVFLRKQLQLTPSDSLFVFCNSAFSPNEDDLLGTLHQCFNTDGELIFRYSLQPAWG